jgi:hypothetical protein
MKIENAMTFIPDSRRMSADEWRKGGFLGICVNDEIKGNLFFLVHESCVSSIQNDK